MNRFLMGSRWVLSFATLAAKIERTAARLTAAISAQWLPPGARSIASENLSERSAVYPLSETARLVRGPALVLAGQHHREVPGDDGWFPSQPSRLRVGSARRGVASDYTRTRRE